MLKYLITVQHIFKVPYLKSTLLLQGVGQFIKTNTYNLYTLLYIYKKIFQIIKRIHTDTYRIHTFFLQLILHYVHLHLLYSLDQPFHSHKTIYMLGLKNITLLAEFVWFFKFSFSFILLFTRKCMKYLRVRFSPYDRCLWLD